MIINVRSVSISLLPGVLSQKGRNSPVPAVVPGGSASSLVPSTGGHPLPGGVVKPLPERARPGTVVPKMGA